MDVFKGCLKILFVLVLLLIAGLSDVTLAGATVGGTICVDLEASSSADQTSLIFDTVAVSDSSLAEIGTELTKIPSTEDTAGHLASVFGVSGVSSDSKVIPAVPAALTLVLTGFLCISLVRDRKHWLAACVGLVCLGQLSISALPRLAGNLRSALKPADISSVISQRIALPAAGFRVRSEVEGTGYIGLLRKLSGIGDDGHSSSFNTHPTTGSVCDFIISTQHNLTYKVSTFVAHIASLYSFDFLLACRFTSAGHISAFSPALVISNLPHGPPV